MTPSGIPASLAEIRARIDAACAAAKRLSGDVQLLAVSKKVPVARLEQAVAAGQLEFGENYVQEALEKIPALPGAIWHFIGPLQSNKAAQVARHFQWVQSVDREKIARKLSEHRPSHLPPLNICVQVNISGEDSKSGTSPEEALALCQVAASLPRLKLRGLMAIPRVGDAASFRAMRELRDRIIESGVQIDTLSMGMTADFAAAIAEGSTMVRIGTAIFGRRPT